MSWQAPVLLAAIAAWGAYLLAGNGGVGKDRPRSSTSQVARITAERDSLNKVVTDLMAKLPPAEAYAKAVFPTLDEQSAHKDAPHEEALAARSGNEQ